MQIEQKEKYGLSEEEIDQHRESLVSFVQGNIRSIRALRSLCQFREAQRFHLDSDQERKLIEAIEEDSGRMLNENSGGLCEISDRGDIEFSHHGKDFKAPLGEDIRAVRGFYFEVSLDGYDYECIVFDGGGSCKYYDLMTERDKKDFLERIANRRRGPEVYIGEPPLLGFTAFFKDLPDGLVLASFLPTYDIGWQ